MERLIVIVLFNQVDLLDMTGPAEVFSLLEREMDQPTGYRVVLAAETLEAVQTSAGVRVLPDITFAQLAGVVAQMPVAAEVGSGDERDELGSG